MKRSCSAIPNCTQCTGIVRVSLIFVGARFMILFEVKDKMASRMKNEVRSKAALWFEGKFLVATGPNWRTHRIKSNHSKISTQSWESSQAKCTHSQTLKPAHPCRGTTSHSHTAMMANVHSHHHSCHTSLSLQSPLLKKIQPLNLLQNFSPLIGHHDGSVWPTMTDRCCQN